MFSLLHYLKPKDNLCYELGCIWGNQGIYALKIFAFEPVDIPRTTLTVFAAITFCFTSRAALQALMSVVPGVVHNQENMLHPIQFTKVQTELHSMSERDVNIDECPEMCMDKHVCTCWEGEKV